MVVKEDGTKWACASCLKGHRVSGCTHVERELTFVPKKGRPITQCPHCRAERKKRSSHIKCDCGEKPHPKEKCIHLREAEARAAAVAAAADGSTTPTNTTTPDPVDPHLLVPLLEESVEDDHHCCCPHGGKCTCSTMKRESPDDSHDPTPAPAPKPLHCRPKPRLTSHQSEGHLTVFANGHHKPVHRNNHAAHECGVPYKLPRSHTSQGVASIARRSVDSLASVQSVSPVTWHQQSSVKPSSPPQEQSAVPSAVQSAAQSTVHSSMPSAVQSERGSPQSDFSMNQQSTFDPRMSIDSTSYTAPEPSSSVASVSNTVFQDFGFPSATSALSIATTSTEPSIAAYSMPTSALEFGNSASDFWSNIDWSRLDASNLETQPALTNASSGTISEIDDLPRVDDLSAFDPQYSIDSQRYGFSTDFTDSSNTNNANSSYGGNFSLNSNTSSNRWSMPAFSSQSNNVVFPALSEASDVKEVPCQTFGIVQPVMQPQNSMISGSSSAQSHSPVADSMYQDKSGDMSNFNWDQLLPTYSNDVVPSNDGSIFGVSESVQNTTTTTAQANDLPTTGSYDDGFDTGFRTMQWDDGVSIPATQDYVNTYNFDPNWPTGNFDPWS